MVYNRKHYNLKRNEKVLYSLIVILLPIIGISIYYALRECNTTTNGYTSIINKVFDVAVILIALWIILSILLNRLSVDTILGRTAVILALIYNLSFFSKRKTAKVILLFAIVILIVIATIIKMYFT